MGRVTLVLEHDDDVTPNIDFVNRINIDGVRVVATAKGDLAQSVVWLSEQLNECQQVIENHRNVDAAIMKKLDDVGEVLTCQELLGIFIPVGIVTILNVICWWFGFPEFLSALGAVWRSYF